MKDLLNNNSNEMKTVVETFVIEETASLIYDNEHLEKWNALITELGLTGQTTIVAPEKSPIPFMHLKQNLVRVFEQLCPQKVDISAYNVTPIPLEILDLIALSKREGYFTDIQIWYDDKTPDPVCIGMKSSYYTYSNTYHRLRSGLSKSEALADKEAGTAYGYSTEDTRYYLLGKWADVKRSFAELTEMATKRFISEKGNQYRSIIKDHQRKLDDLETEAFDTFGDINTNSTSDLLPF